MPTEELLDWIAFNLIPFIGPLSRAEALRRFGSPGEIAHRVPPGTLASACRRPGKAFGARLAAARRGLGRRAASELRRCRRLGVEPVPIAHPDYPAALKEIPDPPVVLYVRGRIVPDVARVAVVGSRRATSYGRRIAGGLAAGLAAAAVEVVSGGARGVDTAAHRGALEAGGSTLAVLGSGFERPYPPENEELFVRIAGSGAMVTEFPLDEAPLAKNFPRRNRLISALSAAVVVVEAAERSGSLSTAGHALDQGREVMAVPGPVSSLRSVGCHRLIQAGAKLVHEVADVLDEIPLPYRRAVRRPPDDREAEDVSSISELTDDERLVLRDIDTVEPIQLDILADRVPIGMGRMQAALFGLEICGAVEQLPGRYYRSRIRKEP